MLEEEIQNSQRAVKTDAYQMSIGEITNMYKDGELIINPDFQRLFRWGIGQKSKLIESLLLGIPLPPIFVFEQEDSKWELIDGLQRVSTILEFLGMLKDPSTGDPQEPSYLVGTKYLPSLQNVVWEKTERITSLDLEDQIELGKQLQLAIRRGRLGVEILKRPSDNNTKYDLFQRLNAGGIPANPQELRNCIIIMVNSDYFTFMKGLAENQHFKSVMSFNEDQLTKQKHLESISRFLVHSFTPYNGKLDVAEYIDEGLMSLAENCETTNAKNVFINVFTILDNLYGSDAFRRLEGGEHTGRSGLAAFECLAIGMAKNITNVMGKPDPEAFVKERIESFWAEEDTTTGFFTPGLRGTTRIQRTLPFGEEWFAI